MIRFPRYIISMYYDKYRSYGLRTLAFDISMFINQRIFYINESYCIHSLDTIWNACNSLERANLLTRLTILYFT